LTKLVHGPRAGEDRMIQYPRLTPSVILLIQTRCQRVTARLTAWLIQHFMHCKQDAL